MNVNDLFPSRFLKAHDLGGKAFTLTIRDITLESVGHGAEQERKLALTFERATKMMLLNRTNAMIIASMYGPETDAWKGKAVTVYSARVKAFGAWHDALRIKEQIPAQNVGAAKMTEAMQEDPPLDDENDLLDVDEGEPPTRGDLYGGNNGEGLDAPDDDPTQASAPVDGAIETLERERLNILMSDLSKDHEARELATIDAKIAALTADNPFTDATPYFVRDFNHLTGAKYDLVKWIAALHKKDCGPCSKAQYGFVTGILDDLTNNQHGYVLSLLCQAEITKTNVPSKEAASALLKYLAKTVKVKDEQGNEVDVPNPQYRKDFADMISEIAKSAVAA